MTSAERRDERKRQFEERILESAASIERQLSGVRSSSMLQMIDERLFAQVRHSTVAVLAQIRHEHGLSEGPPEVIVHNDRSELCVTIPPKWLAGLYACQLRALGVLIDDAVPDFTIARLNDAGDDLLFDQSAMVDQKSSVPSCPSCGSTTTLRALEDELARLRMAARAEAVGTAFGIGSGLARSDHTHPLQAEDWVDHIRSRDDLTVCAECGSVWKPDAKARAQKLREDINDLKGPIQAIGDIDR